MHAILSIKPIYANQIIAGQKTVEFRKSDFKRPVDRVYIYSSAPKKRIIGFFTIKEVIRDSPNMLWERFKQVGGIKKSDFFTYFEGKSEGFTFCIDSVTQFENSIDPSLVIDGFVAPQSYRYLADSLEPTVELSKIEN